MEHIVFVHDLFRVLMPANAIFGSSITGAACLVWRLWSGESKSNGTIGFGMETLGIGRNAHAQTI
jgi:hypothetical protein